MQPPSKHSWINLAELKAQLIRKLGPERSKQYFDYLNRLLSLKLSKVEFDKLVLRIVGRENIPLHNQLIRSILKNACTAKVPPPTHDVEVLNSTRAVGNKKPSSDAYHQNGSLPAAAQASSPLGLANGDILPVSPRKLRTGVRDRRGGDRRSALGPSGKTNFPCQPSSTTHADDFSSLLENGNCTPPDTRRPVQHHQELMQQAENGDEVLSHHPAKFPPTERSPDGLVSVHNKDQIRLLGRGDGKEVSGRSSGKEVSVRSSGKEVSDRSSGKEVSGRSSVHAPLGIPFCPASIGGTRRALPLGSSSKCVSAFSSDGLPDTIALRDRMEQIAATQGLQGVSMDCANVLNIGLNTYLKGLIRSCAELNGSRSGHEPMKNISNKQQAHLKPVNGVRRGHHYQMQSSSWPLEVMQEQKSKCPISLLDFRVAMELNPQQLGEDWPLLLEKICTHAFEE